VSGGRKAGTQRTVLSRALAILGSFSPTHPSMGLVEISRRTGLPVSTVSRLICELCEWGAVERMEDLRYRIGPRLARLAVLRDEGGSLEERGSRQEDGVEDSHR
jgi:DNA-binding IclR family transcriptional regulator